MPSSRLPLQSFWLALALTLTECFAAAQTQIPPVPRPPDPFEHVVNFDIVKRLGTKVPAIERVFVELPWSPGAENPLILVFHGAYYDRHLFNNGGVGLSVQLQELMDEASLRGWITASLEGGDAPDGKNGTYANPEMHQRIRAVIDDLDDLYGVDASRIYTIGHSMGGADAVSYAARHQDPTQWRVAAAFSWSGVLNTSDLGGPVIKKLLWASCDYSNGMLPYLGSSIVHLDGCDCASSGTLIQDGSLIFNLAEVPLTVTHAVSDICSVICGFDAANGLQMSTGELPNLVLDPMFNLSHASSENFDAATICNFFAAASLPTNLPARAYKTVAVEDTRYFYFQVTMASPSTPATFGWDFTGPSNTLLLTDVSQLSALRFRVDDMSSIETPLVSAGTLVIDCSVTDSTLSFQLDNCLNPPTNVLLNGGPAGTPTEWEYDATAKILLLKPQPDPMTLPAPLRWDIQF